MRKAGAILTLAVVAAILWALWPGAASIPARADDQPGAAAAASDPVPADPALNPGGMPWERPLPDRPPIPRKLVIPADISKQTDEQAQAKSKGCLSSGCHAGIEDMHPQGLPIGCVDCHGGNAAATTKEAAHVHPLYARDWPQSGAMPVRSYAMLNDESPAFVRFVNPGDLRAARMSCGSLGCHVDEVEKVRKSMMATGRMLWEAALYNNGVYPERSPASARLIPKTAAPRASSRFPADARGHPQARHPAVSSIRCPASRSASPATCCACSSAAKIASATAAYGTKVRTDPVFLSLHKTRLFDPMLWFLGTNDHPATTAPADAPDATSSTPMIATRFIPAQWAKYGNEGMRAIADKSQSPKTSPASRFDMSSPTPSPPRSA